VLAWMALASAGSTVADGGGNDHTGRPTGDPRD